MPTILKQDFDFSNLPSLVSVDADDAIEELVPLTQGQRIEAEIKKVIAEKHAKNKEAREKPFEDGIHEILEADGGVKEKFVIANGKRNGVCERYSKGILSFKMTYIDDVMDGPAIEFDSKGEMVSKMFYKNNKRHGVVETYEKGHIVSMALFEDDQENGLKITYDAQGNVVTKEAKVNGYKQGIVETYDKLGSLVKTSDFVKDVKHGFQKTFFPEGKLNKIEEFRQGLKEGVDRVYYPNGALKSETEFKNGKIVRIRVDYTLDGKVKG